MNDRQLDNKIRKDVARAKKDMKTLMEDSTARLSRYEGNVSKITGKARDGMTTWVEDNISQLSQGIDKLTGGAMDTAAGTAAIVKKDVSRGLSQYNDRLQEVADRAPAGIGKKATQYPWVAISIALASGLLLGAVIKSARKTA